MMTSQPPAYTKNHYPQEQLPQDTTVIATSPPRPSNYSNYMWLSFVVFFCNPIAGIIAFALSMVSSNAAADNRMDDARKYGRASMWTSIIGAIISTIIAVIVIIWFCVISVKVVDAGADIAKTVADNTGIKAGVDIFKTGFGAGADIVKDLLNSK